MDAKDRSEEAKRLKVLLKLAKGENIILVTSIEAVMRKYIPKEILLENIYTYKIGDVINLEKLSETFLASKSLFVIKIVCLFKSLYIE